MDESYIIFSLIISVKKIDGDEKVNKLLNTRLFGADLKFWGSVKNRCTKTKETKREIKA